MTTVNPFNLNGVNGSNGVYHVWRTHDCHIDTGVIVYNRKAVLVKKSDKNTEAEPAPLFMWREDLSRVRLQGVSVSPIAWSHRFTSPDKVRDTYQRAKLNLDNYIGKRRTNAKVVYTVRQYGEVKVPQGVSFYAITDNMKAKVAGLQPPKRKC